MIHFQNNEIIGKLSKALWSEIFLFKDRLVFCNIVFSVMDHLVMSIKQKSGTSLLILVQLV